MTMLLSEEHRLAQQAAHEFAAQEVKPLAAMHDREQRFPRGLIERAGQLGFLGMLVPQEEGGGGVDEISYSLVLEELAWACASTSVIISVNNMVCWVLHKFGSPWQKETFLRPLAAHGVASFALTEPQAGSDASSIQTRATREGDAYILDGVKSFVTSGSVSRVVMVMAVTQPGKGVGGISAFLVPRDTPGMSVGKVEEKMGLRASDTTELIFDRCRVPATHCLGGDGEGFRVAMNALNRGRIGIAAQCTGIARACLDEALKYATQRHQFGKAIAEFEGIQWMLADMAMETEAARALMFHAASLKDQGSEFIKEASMAKLFASEVANRVAFKALQIHGGYGYLKDFPVERLYRDARVTTLYEGTSEIQRFIIARHLLNRQAGPGIWNQGT